MGLVIQGSSNLAPDSIAGPPLVLTYGRDKQETGRQPEPTANNLVGSAIVGTAEAGD